MKLRKFTQKQPIRSNEQGFIAIILVVLAVLVVIVLIGIFSVGKFFGNPEKATAEAQKESTVISASLDQYFREHGKYPGSLTALGLGDDAITSSQNNFTYRYTPQQALSETTKTAKGNMFRYGVLCTYELVLHQEDAFGEGGGNSYPIAGVPTNVNRCSDPVVVAVNKVELEKIQIILTEAETEMHAIAAALDAYYAQHNEFPLTLDVLGLSAAATTPTNTALKYDYIPHRGYDSTSNAQQPYCFYSMSLYGKDVPTVVESSNKCKNVY